MGPHSIIIVNLYLLQKKYLKIIYKVINNKCLTQNNLIFYKNAKKLHLVLILYLRLDTP